MYPAESTARSSLPAAPPNSCYVSLPMRRVHWPGLVFWSPPPCPGPGSTTVVKTQQANAPARRCPNPPTRSQRRRGLRPSSYSTSHTDVGRRAARCPDPPQLKHVVALPLSLPPLFTPAPPSSFGHSLEKWLPPQVLNKIRTLGCCRSDMTSHSSSRRTSNLFRMMDLSLLHSASPPPRRARCRHGVPSPVSTDWGDNYSVWTLAIILIFASSVSWTTFLELKFYATVTCT